MNGMTNDSYLFYGGPWHNKIVVVPAGRTSYQVHSFKPRSLREVWATDDGFNPVADRVKIHEYKKSTVRFLDYEIQSWVAFTAFVNRDAKRKKDYDGQKIARMCLRRGLTPYVEPW